MKIVIDGKIAEVPVGATMDDVNQAVSAAVKDKVDKRYVDDAIAAAIGDVIEVAY